MQHTHTSLGLLLGTCFVGLATFAGSAHADDDMADKTPDQSAVESAMSHAQMMAQFMTLAQSGPEHESLALMAGNFTASGITHCDPSGPQSFTGTQTSTIILGGRFLQCEYTGTMMGMPFQGFGLTGYNNVKKQYVSLWADTMGTMWTTSSGSANEDRTVFTMTGSYDDPMTGKTTTMRQVTTIIDNDHYTFEMFGPNPDPTSDGAEMNMMKIEYTRQK